jgi:NAD binding domain of 6-phosphogluconate dehydrogenase
MGAKLARSAPPPCALGDIMDIGFIGLGQMGRAIAGHLISTGHKVRVWNRSPKPVKELLAKGAEAAAKPADLADADFLLTMRAEPIPAAIGQETWPVGEKIESANVVKVAGNFMIASAIESMGEAVALTRAHGVGAAAHSVPMPFASVLRDGLMELIATGGADNDWAALALVAARRAGLG